MILLSNKILNLKTSIWLKIQVLRRIVTSLRQFWFIQATRPICKTWKRRRLLIQMAQFSMNSSQNYGIPFSPEHQFFSTISSPKSSMKVTNWKYSVLQSSIPLATLGKSLNHLPILLRDPKKSTSIISNGPSTTITVEFCSEEHSLDFAWLESYGAHTG